VNGMRSLGWIKDSDNAGAAGIAEFAYARLES
jgi:hypothetical protein